jgi:hypothetical protein
MDWLAEYNNFLKDYRRKVAADFFEMHFEEPYTPWDGTVSCSEHYRQHIHKNSRAVRRFQVWESTQLTKAQAVVRGVLTRRVVHSAMCSPDADALPRAIDYCQRASIECPPFPKIV